MDATANGQDDFSGRKTTRTGGLMLRSEKCRGLSPILEFGTLQ